MFIISSCSEIDYFIIVVFIFASERLYLQYSIHGGESDLVKADIASPSCKTVCGTLWETIYTKCLHYILLFLLICTVTVYIHIFANKPWNLVIAPECLLPSIYWHFAEKKSANMYVLVYHISNGILTLDL